MIGQPTGWGQYTLGLTKALLDLGVTVQLPDGCYDGLPESLQARLKPLATFDAQSPCIILRPLAGDCPAADRTTSSPDSKHVALLVAEGTRYTRDQIANLGTFDLVLTGSTWHEGILAQHGLTAPAFTQGVDIDTFQPNQRTRAPRTSPDDPYVIFSGGKLEYRKGHDLVIAAYKQFRQTVPHLNTRLVIAWHNLWPDTVDGLQYTGHLTGLPRYDTETREWHFTDWLASQGVNPDEVIDLGLADSETVAKAIADSDIGIFLSRAEANGNMALAECLASELPCLISPNTGHRAYFPPDLVDPGTPSKYQCKMYSGQEGWTDYPVDLAARQLDLYRFGMDGGWSQAFRAEWGWPTRAVTLLNLLRPLLA